MPARNAEAEWKGDLKSGHGRMKLGSGAWEGAYSFQSRMEDGAGSNPEELIAAAHAGCFSMALSAQLSQAGFPPTRVFTKAKVGFGKVDAGFAITRIDLDAEVEAPGIDDARFQELARQAKEGCPVSKALSSVPISLAARLNLPSRV